HAPPLRGAPRLRPRLPTDPGPSLPTHGRGRPLPLVALAHAAGLDGPGRVAARRRVRPAGLLALVARRLRPRAADRHRRERPRPPGLVARHGPPHVARRAAPGARARLPGVPRARREGPARAHAIRHAPPVPALGDLARRHRALALQLQRCQGGPPELVHGPRTVLARQLSVRAHALRTDHDGGDPDEPDGRLREWRERIRLERRRIRGTRGGRRGWRGRGNLLVPGQLTSPGFAFARRRTSTSNRVRLRPAPPSSLAGLLHGAAAGDSEW